MNPRENDPRKGRKQQSKKKRERYEEMLMRQGYIRFGCHGCKTTTLHRPVYIRRGTVGMLKVHKCVECGELIRQNGRQYP